MIHGPDPGTIPGGAHTVTHGIIVPGGLPGTIPSGTTRSTSTLGIMIPGTAVSTGIHHTGLLRSIMIHGITVTTTGLTVRTITMALITDMAMADILARAATTMETA